MERSEAIEWHVTAVVALMALLIGFMPLPWDPDLWFHLADGRYIAEHLSIPHVDPFSFTRQGEMWVPHSWLFDLGAWLSWQSVGPRGTEVIMALAFMAIALISFWILASRGVNPLLAVGVCLALAIAAANTRGIRPQVFSLLFSNLAILLLVQHCHKPHWRLLIWLPLLFLLWSQIHGASVMGLVIVAVWLTGRGWEALANGTLRDRKPELQIGLAALAASCLAVCITPHRINLFGYMALTMKLKALRYTAEWQPSHLFPLALPDAALYVLMAAIFILLARRGRKVGWAPLSLSLALMLLGTTANRHISLTCIGAVPLLAELLAPVRIDAVVARLQWPWKPVLVTGGIAAIMLGCLWEYPTSNQVRYAKHESVAGCDALCNLDRPLRVFTTHDTGSYVLFRKPEVLRVSLDSRPDVYGDPLWFEVGDIEAGKNWQSAFDRWRVDAAVVEWTDKLSSILHDVPGWVMLAEDPTTRTFVRSDLLAGQPGTHDLPRSTSAQLPGRLPDQPFQPGR